MKQIKTALVSVYSKQNLEKIVNELHKLGVEILSTGGTYNFIKDMNVPVQAVEEVTDYPSILGGRVKTLHPKVFGGILARRDNTGDQEQLKEYNIKEIDLVVVDLYPFEDTVASGASEADIIEKIDIGGISLIRAAAKNYKDVLIVSNMHQYSNLHKLLVEQNGETNLEQRKRFALEAFQTSSHYDIAISNYFAQSLGSEEMTLRFNNKNTLRYGENPHQEASFYGNFDEMFNKLGGKEISYNNLLDIEAAVRLISDFDETTFAILKHNNACGIASRPNLKDAWTEALAGDPVSAFGGVLITNKEIDEETAEEINKLFFEVLIAPDFSDKAKDILLSKSKRIVLQQKEIKTNNMQVRSLLNGVLVQNPDNSMEYAKDMKTVTDKQPSEAELADLEFALKVVKHSKSNAIVLAKNKKLLASGVGQTSRVDALIQAIDKAKSFENNLQGGVMSSDAFFPFPDCVEIANKAGITAVVEPGGSIKDELSIEYCNKNNMAMVFTGVRHFKH